MTRRCWSSRFTTEMGDMERELAALDEMEYLLERMLDLAECSASDSCDDARRKDLQKGLEVLRALLDHTVEEYQRGRTTE